MQEELKKLFDFILKRIADNPNEVHCNVVDSRDEIIVEIHVPDDQKGRIIGKGGKVIKALKQIARLWGSFNKRTIDVVIV
ncbi:MAG: RNA-binding protein [Caldiserica bacterium]|nr:MAG: RNA-binding protein [Caldisericota bacterium]